MIATKPHISASQLETFCKCPEQYRRRYIEGEVIPPGIAMLKGTGLHKGAQVNFTQKMETRTDLPASQIVDAAVEAFKAGTVGGFVLSDDEASRGPALTIGDATDAVADMAKCHAEQQAPDYQPIFVEQAVRIELADNPRDLLGIIDLADDRNRVTDFKTAGKKKSESDVASSTQLTVYAAGFHVLKGEPPSEVRLDTIVKTKTKTERQVLSSTRGEADFVALANRINAVSGAIQAGTFTPAPPGSWQCSQKWCGYFTTCPYVNSERKAKAEE